ncbi:hypothetical protein ACH4JS_15225 [Streptomyces sp. NPDC017638]|uniref:hypothetical protein n=1 Tax=Streptomyces sp. NPDC017638 TaxID=3365004 RepID=UPI00378849D6
MPAAVTACASRAVGLFRIAADAVHGDGLPLAGRDLPEPESDVVAYAEAMD